MACIKGKGELNQKGIFCSLGDVQNMIITKEIFKETGVHGIYIYIFQKTQKT